MCNDQHLFGLFIMIGLCCISSEILTTEIKTVVSLRPPSFIKSKIVLIMVSLLKYFHNWLFLDRQVIIYTLFLGYEYMLEQPKTCCSARLDHK